ncbi:MAG: metallophosphoesterase [Bacteroidales bacterium]
MSKQGKFTNIQNRKKKTLFFIVLSVVMAGGYFITDGAFWFLFTVIYLLPNYYLYRRFRKLFDNQKQRIIFLIIFFLIVAAFPVGEALEHNTNSKIASLSLWVGYYYLPVLLYMFLLYLLIDLTKVLNRLFEFISASALNTRKFRVVSFAGILFVTVIVNIAGIYYFNNTRITEYNIDIKRQASDVDNLKIALAADFHFSERTYRSFVSQFVEKINSSNPDIVLFPGDLIESIPGEDKSEFIRQELDKIEAPYGVYASEGNHELYGNSDKLSFFDKTKIQFLQDTVVVFEDVFTLIGRKDKQDRQRKPLEQLLEATPGHLPKIVLDHQPYELEKKSRNDIALQLSGHTHHGQLFPFNLITKAIYRISWGHSEINDTHFFVTCGAQGWGPPVKTSSYSEIMEINVEFTD